MISLLKKFLCAGLPMLMFFGCSKNENPKPITPPPTNDSVPVVLVKNCQVIYAVAVSPAGDTGVRRYFQYDATGKLTRSIYQGNYGDTVYYSYNGNTIYRAVAAGVNSSVDTITVNNSGFITHDKEVVGNSIYLSNWTYDANMQLTTFTQQQDSNTPVGATYVFTNGDNTFSTDGTFQDTMIYDGAKLAVHGNLDEMNQLLSLGAMYIKNRHLLITERHGAVSTYSYTFNAEGNIASIAETFNNKDIGTIYYTYECK